MEKLSDFKPLDKNPNRHTPRGIGMLEKSIGKFGYVTPMTATADGTIIDGNARLEQVSTQLPADPIIIHHDGTRPIIAVRDDIPTADTKEARGIAIAANRTAEVDLEWSPEEILSSINDGADINDFFSVEEIDRLTGKYEQELEEEQQGLKEPEGDCIKVFPCNNAEKQKIITFLRTYSIDFKQS